VPRADRSRRRTATLKCVRSRAPNNPDLRPEMHETLPVIRPASRADTSRGVIADLEAGAEAIALLDRSVRSGGHRLGCGT
jgi:hypothetical protein